jgi:hypothetical protein
METDQAQSPTFGSFIRGQYLPNVKCFLRSWWTYESLFRIHVFPLLEARPMGQPAQQAPGDFRGSYLKLKHFRAIATRP